MLIELIIMGKTNHPSVKLAEKQINRNRKRNMTNYFGHHIRLYQKVKILGKPLKKLKKWGIQISSCEEVALEVHM